MPSRKELKEALDLAFRHDAQAVVEPCISDGVEVTCTVHDITGDELLEVTRCLRKAIVDNGFGFIAKKL